MPESSRAAVQASPQASARCREAAEHAKRILSTATTHRIDLPFLLPDYNFTTELTREILERIAKSVVEKTREHCQRALADAKLTPADLNEVILVGGSTRMPLVQRFVAELFDKEPNLTQNPDEAIAIGATIQ